MQLDAMASLKCNAQNKTRRRVAAITCATLAALMSLSGCKENASGGADGDATGGASTAGTTPNGPGSDGSPSGNAGGTAGDGNSTATAPSGVSETMHLVGRFVEDANSNKMFSWSGSQISAQFQGTGISMALDEINNISSYGANMYDVSIDGKTATTITAKSGGGTYALATGLPAGLHTVSVTKRTEASIGPARFRGFTVTGGAIVPKVSTVSRRILMVGDSITCGYGVLGTSSTCSFTTATQNVSLTYGALAAAHFNADVQFTSWSGKGIYRNNDGTTDATMGDLFNLALPSDSTSTYDWTQFVPDAIVINLGTNDFSATYGEPTQSNFQTAYLAMLKTLNTAYPKAHVILVAGPMVVDNYPIGTTYFTDLKAYLNAIAQAAPNSSTTVLDLTPLTDAQKGCDSHPNQAAHALMAQSLETALSTDLGWQ